MKSIHGHLPKILSPHLLMKEKESLYNEMIRLVEGHGHMVVLW